MKRMNSKFAKALGVVAVASLGLTACAGGTETAPEEPASSAPASSSAAATSAPASESAAMDPAANLVGPGCEGYAEQVPDGEGSVAGMAQDPVAVAASNNPLLTTLTAAVSGELNPDVDLVDTLNSDEFTVFAPVDDAFAAIPEADLTAAVEDADTLSSILTYHVIPGQLTPDEVVGMQTSVQGADVEITGSGDELMVNGASVICGGVQTANATVYLIDTVLMPPAE
ncbi:fasciclin domain-containing protein [Arthrobacter sp. KK5.5]|uniref:fasciclin domain-containing protein n=1 Tax=Arthrobacter sp. KK5.5 TaxID=3373084 RepID=UPI003EE5E139